MKIEEMCAVPNLVQVECMAKTDKGVFVLFTIGEEDEPEMLELDDFMTFCNRCMGIQEAVLNLFDSLRCEDDCEDDR